jgi:hypothetical protein
LPAIDITATFPGIPMSAFAHKVLDSSFSSHLSQSSRECAAVDFTNVLKAGDSRPMSAEDPPSIGVGLALGDDADTGSLEAEIDTSDS